MNFFKKTKKVYAGKVFEDGKMVEKYKTITVINVPRIVMTSIIGLFLLITLFSSFSTIKSGEVGLKVKFGKIVDSKLDEGFNFKVPYIEKIVKVNIKVQKAEITTESSTKDLQIVNSTIAVNYRVDSRKAPKLYRTVGNTYEETVLQPAIKESIKSAIAKYNAEEITINRSAVSKDCLEQLQNKVKKYGIIIEDFNLTDFSFTTEYTKAIEEKQVAEQNLEKSKLEAEKKIVEAEATNKANELLKQNVNKEVLQKQFLDKWNGELPKVTSSDNLFDISSFLGN
jgi:regulator of protease activity HflC (stomatin/prohibitin superfamily)